jgi:2-polyprenyl-6-methoxyphenol hydroxylase-like FAD-dependent oxidoreductase
MDDILIVGAGIGGLTLALELHRCGVPCRIFESAPEIKAVGVGINLLPHATEVLGALGLVPQIERVAVETAEAAFFNRFGQLIYKEALGRRAGYAWPQFSIHRADLQSVLLDAVKARIGAGRMHLGWHCLGFEQQPAKVALQFRDRAPVEGKLAVGCDGIHSVIRKQLYPAEGEPRYSGVNMWRGVTRWKPVLSGASMLRAGWLATGKLVHYPIRHDVDETPDGTKRQLVNWLWEIETPNFKRWDWNRPARVEDFIAGAESWRFDWLDVPAFLRAAELVLEYPMVDKDPLPAWSFGRVTLLGDAAHPMVPRGSNGAGQAILDASALAESLADDNALKKYEALRLEPTSNVVLENRRNPPDAILREVYERTGDRPFERIEDVIGAQELAALSERYKQVAGYDIRDTRQASPRR